MLNTFFNVFSSVCFETCCMYLPVMVVGHGSNFMVGKRQFQMRVYVHVAGQFVEESGYLKKALQILSRT